MRQQQRCFLFITVLLFTASILAIPAFSVPLPPDGVEEGPVVVEPMYVDELLTVPADKVNTEKRLQLYAQATKAGLTAEAREQALAQLVALINSSSSTGHIRLNLPMVDLLPANSPRRILLIVVWQNFFLICNFIQYHYQVIGVVPHQPK